MEPRLRNVDHSWYGEGGAVPDGIHPRDGQTYYQERFSPVPQAQLGSLIDPWVPPQHHLKVTRKSPLV